MVKYGPDAVKPNAVKPIEYIFSNSHTKPTLKNIKNHTLYIFEKCPICNKVQYVLYGYSRRVCDNCVSKYYTMDSSNNRLLFGNLGICGGMQAFKLMADISENLIKHELPFSLIYNCYIKEIPILAQECKYGGIIYTAIL